MEAKTKNEELLKERNNQYESLVEDLKTKLNTERLLDEMDIDFEVEKGSEF